MKERRRIPYQILLPGLAVLLAALFFVWRSGFGTQVEAPPDMDLSLDLELGQAEEVRERFLEEGLPDGSLKDPQEAGSGYLPQGAVCTDVSVLGEAVYLDYRMGDVRYLTAYYRDGTVEKTARRGEDEWIYFVDSAKRAVSRERVR